MPEAERIIELERELAEMKAQKTAGDSAKAELDSLSDKAKKLEAERDSYKQQAVELAQKALQHDADSLKADLRERGFTDADCKEILTGATHDNVMFAQKVLGKISKGTASSKTVKTVDADSDLPPPAYQRFTIGADGKTVDTWKGGKHQ